jgi:hypothetical protein
MSFGINVPDHIPSIQKSQKSSDGGAGNLGYFQQGKKKKDEEKNEEQDVFQSSTKKNLDEDPLLDELDSIGTKIKNFWMKLNNPFMKENPEES